ncbi:MAG TPA: hypothetical protein DEV93_20605 [Chloroflexi bacterium]|nr:hypothetical protein [Chloroflexota bacterium]
MRSHLWNPESSQGVAALQGSYYAVSGLWPIASIGTFQLVTGRKHDLWLVKTVGLLIATIGSVLMLSARREETSTEIATLGIASAAAIAGIDLIYYANGVLRWVYLVDAAMETAIVGGWARALARGRGR